MRACRICGGDLGRRLCIDGAHHTCVSARQRLSTLAANLAVAGGLCAAHHGGIRYALVVENNVKRAASGLGVKVFPWFPGCDEPDPDYLRHQPVPGFDEVRSR